MPDPKVIRRRLLVSGLVQGVNYRYSCRLEALRAGVTGWATNRADGRVEVVLEGPADAVARVEAWCHTGPPHANVTGVDGHDEEVAGLPGFDAF